ncbi:MAG: hypothetical protein HOW73_19950 [Polyangiaceae bacterium]|nr:hypothetical protein [Polyangiaceae bacterium]
MLPALFLVAQVASADGAVDPSSRPSIHQLSLEHFAGAPVRPTRLPPKHVLTEGRAKTVGKVVYGYYPYWAHDLTTIRWQALTHLAWFSVTLDASGNATTLNGWPDAETVAAAHEADVRVDLSFTLFSGEGIRTLVNDPGRRANAVATMIDLMEEGGADGIAVDFEGFIDGTRAGFVTFISELRAELDARGHTDAQISLAGPAVDWGDEWDVAALLDSADYFFIMGYDYFWSGSGYAGPVGIFRLSPEYQGKTSWSGLRSVANYTSLVGPEKRTRIIYGVPYYGRQWSTTSSALAASTSSDMGSVTYSASVDDLAGGAQRLWDDGTKNPYYVFQSGGTWQQVYYDDAESLGYKMRLAVDEDLGGVGMWALNYDAPHPELWDALEEELPPMPAAPAAGHRLAPIPIDTFPFHHEGDTTSGPSQYFNFYSCDASIAEYGKEFVYEVDLCQAGTLSAHVPEAAGVDPDVHLLSDVREDACLARGHTDLSFAVQPGRYYVTVDTFVSDGVELEGPFTLDVDFAPEVGTQPCADHLECHAGVCECPTGSMECGGDCVDTSSDPAHCGGCDAPCAPGLACQQGVCGGGGTGGAGDGGGQSGGGDAVDGGEEGSADCTCRAAGASRSSDLGLRRWPSASVRRSRSGVGAGVRRRR